MMNFDMNNKSVLVNSTNFININLSMKEDKKEIFKELIINYLLKQINEKK